MKSGKDFRCLRDDSEICLLPRRAAGPALRLFSLEVLQRDGQAWLALQEIERQGTFEERSFLGHVNRDARIYLQKMGKATRVVAMAVGDYDCVELRQVDPERLNIALECVAVVTGIEQN